MNFPITISNQDEFDDFIIEYKEIIQEKLEWDRESIEKEVKERKYLETLKDKKDSGENSIYKGEMCEQQIQIDLSECLKNTDFIIDNKKINKSMDRRIINESKKINIGLEIKAKKKLIKRIQINSIEIKY